LRGRGLYECPGCGYQASLTAGTLLHKTRTDLRKWLPAIWLLRRKRLEAKLEEEKLLRRGAQVKTAKAEALIALGGASELDIEDFEDLENLPDEELEELEEQVVDQASAAQTTSELQLEIATLALLERLAHKVPVSNCDRKWEQLSSLLQEGAEMFDVSGQRRKLIVFTEPRDTLSYLVDKIRTVLGRSEAVVAIHGGVGRQKRREAQEYFTQDKDALVLVATDAAGEGINLQRAHLMVNYDLPWNPNRIEQRFGRIHRIGQSEVCHLWNLLPSSRPRPTCSVSSERVTKYY